MFCAGVDGSFNSLSELVARQIGPNVTREALLCGGKRGPAIALGKPDESLLIQSVRQTSDLKMPRRGKLSPEEVQALADWIKDGAPWPQRTDRGWKDQLVKVVDCVL